ncbi:MAG: four helix bundle protein [Bryobacteraceae bacterium]|jgi:four helix bundle protein
MRKSYRDLEVWRLGLELVETIYRCTSEFPENEIYGLAAQMRRAAVSIPSNIAEGQARSSSKEFLHVLSFSLGSLAELVTQLELASRLGYMDTNAPLAQAELVGKKLHCLRTSIRERLPTTNNQQLTTNN